jgi:hypothetical protein
VQPITIPIHAVLGAITLVRHIQRHFEACGVHTHRSGTGFETVKGEDGQEQAKHTGKRAIVEVGFHSLRHTFVSLCREANAPLAVVEAIVGHATPSMTRHYTHISELAAGQAVAALPDIIGAAKPVLPASTDGGTVPKGKSTGIGGQADREERSTNQGETPRAARHPLIRMVSTSAGTDQAVTCLICK